MERRSNTSLSRLYLDADDFVQYPSRFSAYDREYQKRRNEIPRREGNSRKPQKSAIGSLLMAKNQNSSKRVSSHDAILEAAIQEFAEHGRDGVRMEKVAERAGLNKSLVYRHFENRENLFEAALESVFSERFQLLEDLPDDLTKLFDVWTKRFEKNPLFTQLLMRESLETESEEPIHAELREKYYRHQVDSMRRLQERGKLPQEADAESLFLMLTAVLVFPHLLPQVTRLVTGHTPNSSKFKKQWKKLFEILLKGLSTD